METGRWRRIAGGCAARKEIAVAASSITPAILARFGAAHCIGGGRVLQFAHQADLERHMLYSVVGRDEGKKEWDKK